MRAFSVAVEVITIKPSLVRFLSGPTDIGSFSGYSLYDATQGTGYYSIDANGNTPAGTIVSMSPNFRGSTGGSGGGGINLVYDPGKPPPVSGTPIMPTLTIAANLRLVTNIDPTQAYYGSYETFQALYPGTLGQLPILGVAPQTFATTINIPYYENPTASQYKTGPGMFIDPSPATLLGQTVSTTVGGGTLTGLSPAYVDADGNSWTTVNWQWVMIADRYQYGTATGFYKQQVLQYTGDGTANRLISTALDLTAGKVTVWIQGGVGNTIVDLWCMRSTGMTTTLSLAAGDIGSVIGITALQAAGFRVSYGTVAGIPAVNNTGTKYTAIIMQDTTSDNRYMTLGTYTGDGTTPRTISVGGSGAISHLWVFGRFGCYRSTEFPGLDCLAAMTGTNVTTNNVITALNASSFIVGSGEANQNATAYKFVALKIDASLAAQNIFKSFTGSGAGSPPTTVTGLGFTPSIAHVERLQTPASASAMVWRGQDHVGTDSAFITSAAAFTNDDAAQGITAINAGGLNLGTDPAPSGQPFYGYAWAGGTSSQFAGPSNFVPGAGVSFINSSTITNPDGKSSTLETTVLSQTKPTTPGLWVQANALAAAQWWCSATLGQSVFQSVSPGAGWVPCAGPTTANGWYFSVSDYGAQTVVVSGGKPANPRTWIDISVWATSNQGMLGGSPAASCTFQNTLIYPATGYTVGTTLPSLRVWDGRQDRELCLIPKTPALVMPQAVLSMLSANGTVYFSTFDTGTTSATWSGRVLQLDPLLGKIVPLGVAFVAGEMPYALAWHMGRLWCGTNNGIGTMGKVYYFRPGIDTVWTQDHDLATETLGGVDSLVSYLGKLYVGSDNAAAANGKILVRDTAGAYTVTETGSGGTAVVNNGYLAMVVYQGNLYASYWNNAAGTPVVKIRKFDGTTWSTVFTGATATLKPYILLFEDHNFLYAVGGKTGLVGSLISSPQGTAWTDLTPQLPPDATSETLLPVYGVVIL